MKTFMCSNSGGNDHDTLEYNLQKKYLPRLTRRSKKMVLQRYKFFKLCITNLLSVYTCKEQGTRSGLLLELSQRFRESVGIVQMLTQFMQTFFSGKKGKRKLR